MVPGKGRVGCLWQFLERIQQDFNCLGWQVNPGNVRKVHGFPIQVHYSGGGLRHHLVAGRLFSGIVTVNDGRPREGMPKSILFFNKLYGD